MDTTDLAAPLSRLWRSVYQKAAAVAESRTLALVREHVYAYHPNGIGGGGGGGGEDTGPWVDEAGDTMTGTLNFHGEETVDEGAIRVYGTGALAEARVYGEETPPYAPDDAMTGGAYDHGVRFRPLVDTYLVALRWYRTDAYPTPDAVSLWDSTATSAPVWSAGALPAWSDPTVGWKEHRLPVGDEVALVADRVYALSYHMPYDPGEPTLSLWAGLQFFAPTPDAGLEFLQNVRGATGTYPADLGGDVYVGLDGVFRTSVGPGIPAQSGAIRLPYGAEGAIAWRRTDQAGDHTLTVNEYPPGSGTDQLLFDGAPVGGGTGNTTMHTQTTAPTGATNSLWFNPSESA